MSNKMALDALTPLTRDETEHGREYFDAARASSGATTQAVRMPAVTAFNVGRFCLSEDDCIAQRIDFSAYERGVADAAEAFSRNT